MQNPNWWTDKHESAWSRVKSALKRDWEQTKADFTKKDKRVDLDQGAGDTVKQMAGKEAIPPAGVANPPNPKDAKAWETIEQDYRYGVGARAQYGSEHDRWDEQLEGKLASDWESMNTPRPWDEAKPNVRRAWERDGSSK
jgi:hypothetical protein